MPDNCINYNTMRGVTVLAIATGLLSTSQAIHLVKRESSSNVPRINIQRKYVADPVAHDLRRRGSSKTVQETLENEVLFHSRHYTDLLTNPRS